MKDQDFHAAISKLLSVRLNEKLLAAPGEEKRSLNLTACVEIYTTIFETMAEVITDSKIELSNEAVNFLAQQYYDGVLVNGTQELDPDIFTQRAKVENIPTSELALLVSLLKKTDFAAPVVAEIKKRS